MLTKLSTEPLDTHSVHHCVILTTVSIKGRSLLNLPQSNPSTILAESGEIVVDDRDKSCYNFSALIEHTHTSHQRMNEPPVFFFFVRHVIGHSELPHTL